MTSAIQSNPLAVQGRSEVKVSYRSKTSKEEVERTQAQGDEEKGSESGQIRHCRKRRSRKSAGAEEEEEERCSTDLHEVGKSSEKGDLDGRKGKGQDGFVKV